MKRSEARGLLEGPLNHLLDPAKRPLIEAFSKGEEIQIYHKPVWDDGGDDVSFTCAAEFYRVKPESESLFCVLDAKRRLCWAASTREKAEQGLIRANKSGSGERPYQIVEYVEKL